MLFSSGLEPSSPILMQVLTFCPLIKARREFAARIVSDFVTSSTTGVRVFGPCTGSTVTVSEVLEVAVETYSPSRRINVSPSITDKSSWAC